MKDWKQFEVLVAALHHSSTNGGTVTWDERINGRQFDVTVRFTHAGHDYLTVIECRDQEIAVPVSTVEAFVTKARGVQANKSVVVSSSGYQSGAISVAERENVVLLTAREEYSEPALPDDAEKIVVANIYDLAVRFTDGRRIQFPDGSKLEYLAKKSYIGVATGERESIDAILSAWVQQRSLDETEDHSLFVSFPEGSAFFDQEGTMHTSVAGLEFRGGYIDAYHSKSSPPLDFQLQQALARKWVLSRVDGTPVLESFFTELSMGLWTDVEEGGYYANPALGFFYRCEEIVGSMVTWFLVESYQHGNLLQARFTAATRYNDQYIPVVDKEKLAELDKLYRRVRKREEKEARRSFRRRR